LPSIASITASVILIRSEASPTRFSYAWYSSRCAMVPSGELAWKGFGSGACAAAQ
jgi:hypothetical protein